MDEREEILTRALHTLETGGRECLLSCLQLVLSLDLPCQEFMLVSRRYIFEFRKNEVFWPGLVLLIRLCMKSVGQCPGDVVTLLLELITESETVAAICPVMIKCIRDHFTATNNIRDLETMLPVLARALTHGPVFRRDQKLVTDTNHFIFSLGPEFEANMVEGSDHLMNSGVRVDALMTLIQMKPSSELIMKLFSELQIVNTEVTGKRTRHFENSNIHKVRQRIYQSYLILLPLLSPDDSAVVLDQVSATLMQHGEQTSVRYYCEWILTITVLTHPHLLSVLWSCLSSASVSKTGAVPSFIIILTQVLVHVTDVTEDMVEQCIREVSPWCMAQNFYTRIVAQLCFRKLWTTAQTFPDLSTKYQPLHDCISRSVNPANADKLTQDFYLTSFDPVACYNLCDILHHVPRLCDISQDELIPLELINNMESGTLIPRESGQSVLSSVPRKVNNSKKETRVEGNDGTTMNIQKKVTPWTWSLSDTDLGLVTSSRHSHKRAHPHLLVVASLIDKTPNLGGLCRTCEIFGAGGLVLGNKHVLQDKEFSAVSVTSEQWLPLTECPPHKLASYLLERKREGFRIVAVEQTSESRSMLEYVFPVKTVVLLGREKEGVPVELLNIVDDCVEIPQSGLIRSLNVHVTGALVIWEYVRQLSSHQ